MAAAEREGRFLYQDHAKEGVISKYKVIAAQGPGRYLLVEKCMDDPEGDARLLDRGLLFPAQSLQAFLGRGYWEDATLSDADLDALLEAATEVPHRGNVPLPTSRPPS